ncbi:MAG: hypothetical protein AAFW65_04935 [Pseudomonadota bacterium]
MSERQISEMFAVTPWWLWPVLWWSLGRHQAWLARFRAEHGPREVLVTVTAFGTIRVLHIGDLPDTDNGHPRITRAAFLAFARAMRPARVISQPVRTASCAFARRADVSASATGAWAQAPAPRPASLAPG